MIEELICLLFYLITEFINYTLTYGVIFQSPITKKKKTWFFSFLFVMVIHILTLYWGGLELSFNISIFTMIIVPICLLETRKIRNYLLYLFVVYMSTTVISCVSFILAVVLNVSESSVRKAGWLTVVCQMVPAFLLFCVFSYLKIRRKEEIQIQLGVWQHILILICLILNFPTCKPGGIACLLKQFNLINWYIDI